jgi:hypothetical protein
MALSWTGVGPTENTNISNEDREILNEMTKNIYLKKLD